MAALAALVSLWTKKKLRHGGGRARSSFNHSTQPAPQRALPVNVWVQTNSRWAADYPSAVAYAIAAPGVHRPKDAISVHADERAPWLRAVHSIITGFPSSQPALLPAPLFPPSVVVAVR